MTSSLVLAIETSGAPGSTALLRGLDLVAQRQFDPAMRGGSALAPGVAHVLSFSGGEPLSLIAVGIGPGSYTGTRVGVVYAKTFAFARNLPLVGVSGLEAVAFRCCERGRCAVAMRAHEHRVYGAVYECEAGTEPRVVLPPALIERAELLAAAGPGSRIVDVPPEAVLAADIGRLAWLRHARTGVSDALATLEPLYLQLPPPERGAAT